jgi:hypothetical protein
MRTSIHRTRAPRFKSIRTRHEVSSGSAIVSPSFDELMAAIRNVDPELPFNEVADGILPVFRRRRPYPKEMPALLYLRRPPGLDVGVAIDIGHAYMHVDERMLERWDMTADAALARAVENVRRRATTKQLEPIVFGDIGGVPTKWFQSGQSIGSALILAPDLIVERFGTDEQFILAPMRDLLVSVPIEAGYAFAADLYESIAEEDPNCLDLPVLTLVDGRVLVAAPGSRSAKLN